MKTRLNLLLTAACAALAAVCLAAGAHAWLQGVARVLASTVAVAAFGVEAQPAIAPAATGIQTTDSAMLYADSQYTAVGRDEGVPGGVTPSEAIDTGNPVREADAVRTSRAPPGR